MAMERAMEEFMRRRGIPQPIIEEMTLEKIDCETMSMMSDDDLKRFIPLYGDRLAIVTFAKSQVRAGSNPDNNQQEIRASTMGRKRKCPYGNKNASRTLRRVELGWVNYNQETSSFKQVRTKNGGGTRQLLMEKNLNVCDICALAKSTFFPNNNSKFGTIDEFNCEIRDFKGDDLPLIKTVDDIYTDSKIKILRLYLYTKKKPTNNTDTTKPEESESSSDEFVPFNLPVITITSTSQQSNTAASLPVVTPSTDASPHESTQSTTASERVVSLPIIGTGLPVVTDEQPSCSRAEDEFDSGIPEEDFVAAGTPTVSFRRNLSLHHRRSATCSYQPTPRRQEQGPVSWRPCIEAIEIQDSDDEAMERALQSSPHVEPSDTKVDNCNISVILQEFHEKYTSDQRSNYIISRRSPLESALRCLEKKSPEHLKYKVFVKFTGEMGQDHGGPRRELFRLALAELATSKFLEGPEYSKVFTHNLELVEKGQYRMLGRLVALSLVHGGPGIHCINKQLFSLMVGQEAETTPPEQIMDSEILQCLEMLENIDTDQKRDQFLSKYADSLLDKGIINIYRFQTKDIESVKHMLIKYHIFYRISAEISQFKEGMNDVGEMWQLITTHSDKFQPLFCHQVKALSKQDMDKMFKYDFSAQGSNSRQFEEDTVYSWEVFLQDLEDGTHPTTLEEVLAFMTGASNIPPYGFDRPLEIHFYTQEEGVTRLPSVSTCSLEMWLPRGVDPETLTAMMLKSMRESPGFLKI